jgi:hypothetical protein
MLAFLGPRRAVTPGSLSQREISPTPSAARTRITASTTGIATTSQVTCWLECRDLRRPPSGGGSASIFSRSSVV